MLLCAAGVVVGADENDTRAASGGGQILGSNWARLIAEAALSVHIVTI